MPRTPRNHFALLPVLVLSLAAPARAEPVADFYRGRSVTLVIGYSAGGGYDAYGRVLARHLGRHIPGTAEVALAIERGEVDGRCGWSWSSLKLTKPDWIAGKRVNLVAQLALNKSPELPDVPLIFDFATTERQRQILKLMLSRQSMARPFAAPPDLPEDRKAALRTAFDRTMADAEFLAEARQRGLEVNPVSGAEIDKLVSELYQTPADIVAELRAIISEGAR